ncbi:sodium channel protein Nach-like [Anopheles bellator]|uniref:sodium channel protein Nach-like n=1 Tax=Anopheles bellator TaxID=139047 RepID=UPI002648F341|nr:sodium channel protein Nach-like [Anopheles bellator]
MKQVLVALWETVRTIFRNFCENTSLHGLRYVYGKDGARKGGMLRLVWLLVCAVSIGFTTVMGMIAWIRFRNTPTITTIETTTYPIWKIPFPAVTVCNVNKIDSKKADAIIDRLVKEFGLSEANATQLLIAQASLINFERVNDSFLELEGVLGRMGWNPGTLLLELSQPCAELIKVCYWLGVEIPCPKIIRRTRTDNGYCCSYNVDDTMEPLIAQDNQSTPPTEVSYRPKRLSGAGRHVGLSLLIDVQPDTYMAPTKSFYGAEIYVHDPKDFPSDADFEHVAQPGWDVVMSVIPLPIESSSTMNQVPLAMRKCFLPEEDDDDDWDENFNLNVCLSECRLRTIISLCNCIPFYFVDLMIDESKDVKICALKNVECLRYFRRYFYSLRTDTLPDADHSDSHFGMDCDCKPPCSVLNYNVQTIASQRQTTRFKSANYGGRDVTMYATLNVHFKDMYCVKYKRDAYMTWDSLVATFGGIFGLCMGGSVLSIVELLYYFTVKPFTVYKAHSKRSRHQKQPQPGQGRRVAVRPYVSPYSTQRYGKGYFVRPHKLLSREKDIVRNTTLLGMRSSEKSPSLAFIY